MKTGVKFAIGGAFGALFLLWILLLRVVDVQAIGPEGTEVGFANMNKAVANTFGYNQTWYKITQYLGYFALLVAGALAVWGFIQLVTRKSLLKVDMNLLLTGGLFLVVIAFYLLFNKVAVNYRPIILPGEDGIEASFPSSHTMLTCAVMGSVLMLLSRYIQNASLRWGLRLALSVVMILTVVGRLISGAHWLTDILGGLFLSASLLMIYSGLLDKFGTYEVEE